MQVVLVPIDSRPVTYKFPQQVAAVAGVEVFAPPLEVMGALAQPSDRNALFDWVEELLIRLKPEAAIICLDSLLYGGLVASRCSRDPLSEILERQKRISGWKKLCGGGTQIFAQASVMRIPHYNTTVTEPAYWQEYGERIFRWSVLKHKRLLGDDSKLAEMADLENQIPQAVLSEFLERRDRNFKVNQSLIASACAGDIDYLVFSQDDTAEYGLNVFEKGQIQEQARANKAHNVIAYAGTDETISVLLSRYLLQTTDALPKAAVRFSPREGAEVLSKFEGQTVSKSLNAVADVIGIKFPISASESKDDFAVILHTEGRVQGDHLGDASGKKLDTTKSVDGTIKMIEESSLPVVLCDVAYSNGADPCLIEALLKRPTSLAKLSGYAGWNTTNNTIGSALSMGIATWYAQRNKIEVRENLMRALFVRFMDDWAYQSVSRSHLNGTASDEAVERLMVPFVENLSKALNFDPGAVSFRLPWKRSFEVEVCL